MSLFERYLTIWVARASSRASSWPSRQGRLSCDRRHGDRQGHSLAVLIWLTIPMLIRIDSQRSPMPRQHWRTSPSAAKSILISMGTIMSQIRTATARLTLAISIATIA